MTIDKTTIWFYQDGAWFYYDWTCEALSKCSGCSRIFVAPIKVHDFDMDAAYKAEEAFIRFIQYDYPGAAIAKVL